MITYLYWAFVFGLAIAAVIIIGVKLDNLKSALAVAAIVLLVGWALYYFNLQQLFVKRWGGVMSINMPAGQYHIATTWKGNELWIENYDPATNSCIFSENSRGNLLQGRVTIKNCNPLGPAFGGKPPAPSGADAAPQLQSLNRLRPVLAGVASPQRIHDSLTEH